MNVPRACLTCQFFSLDFGEQGYSEMTPGSEPRIGCEKSLKRGCAWPRDDQYGHASAMGFVSIAANCKFFEPHASLVPAEGAA